MTYFFSELAYCLSDRAGVYALIAGVLVALCSSLFGSTLVLKRCSFIGDGLSHVAFGAMAIAAVVGVTNDMVIILPVTVLASILLLSLGQNSKIKGDSAIAMISVSALAVGYFVMNVFSVSGNVAGDVCTSLFASYSIFVLKDIDIILCIVLSIAVIAYFVIFYNRIFAITFDEDFAVATGLRARLYNLMTAVIISVVIVLAMKLVGSLLIAALVVFPAMSAMRVCKSFKSVVVASAVISVLSAAVGILVSMPLETPVGSSVVITNIISFALLSLVGALRRKK